MYCEKSVNLLTNGRQFASFVIRQQLNSPCKQGWSGKGCLWVCGVRIACQLLKMLSLLYRILLSTIFLIKSWLTKLDYPPRPRTATWIHLEPNLNMYSWIILEEQGFGRDLNLFSFWEERRGSKAMYKEIPATSSLYLTRNPTLHINKTVTLLSWCWLVCFISCGNPWRHRRFMTNMITLDHKWRDPLLPQFSQAAVPYWQFNTGTNIHM